MRDVPRLLHVFSTFRVGGPQVRFSAIANHWGNQYHHAVLAMDGAYDCFERLDPGLGIEQLSIAAPKHRTLRNVLNFRRVLHARRPDLLVTYNWGAMEWAFANRPQLVPHLHIEDGFGPEETDGQLRRRVLARRFALAHSLVVVPSLTLRRLALEKWHLSPSRVRYIPNGIDCGRFARRCEPIAIPEGQGVIIGTVAALRPEKKIERLLDAFRIVRGRIACRLLIAGDGPERPRLERIARETLPAGSVIFAGHTIDVERVYAGMDIFALSSETEQMPTSVMEAMASGLPVAATCVGDVPEMVGAGGLPFVVPRDSQALGEAIYRLAVDEVSRSRLGEENRQLAKSKFDSARMFREYGMVFSGDRPEN